MDYPPGSSRLSSYTSPTMSVIYDAAIAQSRVFDICFTQRREKVSRLVKKLIEQTSNKNKINEWISTNYIRPHAKKKTKRTRYHSHRFEPRRPAAKLLRGLRFRVQRALLKIFQSDVYVALFVFFFFFSLV